jgi:hypothetical protein
MEPVMSKYKSSDDIEGIAMGLYYLDWKQLASGNFPPTWECAPEKVRKWMRERVRDELSECETQIGNLFIDGVLSRLRVWASSASVESR